MSQSYIAYVFTPLLLHVAKPTKLLSPPLPSAKQSRFVSSPSTKSLTMRKTAKVDDIVEVLEELQQVYLEQSGSDSRLT